MLRFVGSLFINFSSSHLPVDSNDERGDEVCHFSAIGDQLIFKREKEMI